MIRITELPLPLDYTPGALRQAVVKRLAIADEALLDLTLFKRSYDARKKNSNILFVCIVDVEVRDENAVLQGHAHDRAIGLAPDTTYHPVAQASPLLQERPLVVGFGPCGLFAALLLAQMGFRPIVLERGREVRRRTKDTWALWQQHTLTAESNVQFGEGGAGLFSDGKLYSQIKDPKFYGRKVMREFVRAGAPPEILYVSKPHIGTFRLTGVVAAMREEIIGLGGEVRFESRVSDLIIENGGVEGVMLANGETLHSRHVVLALGHSSRDTFRMLEQRGVFLEAKPFAIGFRIEHPQSMVDVARLGRFAGHPDLGAADYKLVHHARNGRSVYSFCMCPGGTVVAATSEPNRVVTNGMSQYSRNERNANAGIVVGIDPARDYPDGPLAGVTLQESLESRAFVLGGSNYCAPGQLVGDFLRGEPSAQLGEIMPSYKPGVLLGDLSQALPDFAIEAIREALPAFGSQMRGFDRDDAVLTGVESRTSSPVRITRDAQSLQSLNVRGLYPCGEGAGYAGGILSAGVDGIKVAEAVARSLCMKIEDIRKLQQKKHREEAGCFLLEGEHLVQELQKAAVHDARLRTSEIHLTREFAHWQSQLATHVVTAHYMRQISETRSPQGIAAVVPLLPVVAPRAGERAIYLHQIQDPGNLGSILRTLAWFGNFRCLLGPDSVDAYNGKAVRASMGAIFHVPVEADVEMDTLRGRFERIATLELAGESITSPAFRDCQCYVYGNEARGLPREALSILHARPFTIAGSGVMESLNVAAAVTICQYELAKARG